MKYLSFVLLIVSFVSAPTYGTTKSARGLADFTAISGSDPDFTGFLASDRFRRVPTTHSRHDYATHLEGAFEAYKASLTGGGGEAPATPTEIAAMKSNSLVAVRDALDQWLSYLAPKEDVASSFWNDILLNPLNRRVEMGEILTHHILEFVPTDHPPYSTTVRTALENLKKDVTEPEGYASRIADGDLTFTTIGGRITAIKELLPTPSAFGAMESHSTSRDIYDYLWAESMGSRTFSQGDLKKAISWANRRIGWLKKKIDDLSAEVVRLRGVLAAPRPVIKVTEAKQNTIDSLTSLGFVTTSLTATQSQAPLTLVDNLAIALSAEKRKAEKVDLIRAARNAWIAAPNDPAAVSAQSLLDVINPFLV